MKRALIEIGTGIKTEPGAETTDSLAENIRMGYRRLPEAAGLPEAQGLISIQDIFQQQPV